MGACSPADLSGTGVFRPTNGLTYLRNDPATIGAADIQMVYAVPNDKPVAGHWSSAGLVPIRPPESTSALAPTFVPGRR